jgi:sugar phosphate isomerase/epimerase
VGADEWCFFSSTPVGDGIVDNVELVRLLARAKYQGFLAVEIDFLHPDYDGDEDWAVAKSIQELKKIAAAVELENALAKSKMESDRETEM